MKPVSSFVSQFIEFFYFRPIRKFIPRDIFFYGAAGGLNMFMDTLLYFFVYHFVVLKQTLSYFSIEVSPHISSLFIVFPITFLVGFYLNRNVVFLTSSERKGRELGRYLLSVLGSLLLNYILMKLFVDVLGIWPTPSKVLSTATCIVYSFLMGKFYTFTCGRN